MLIQGIPFLRATIAQTIHDEEMLPIEVAFQGAADMMSALRLLQLWNRLGINRIVYDRKSKEILLDYYARIRQPAPMRRMPKNL